MLTMEISLGQVFSHSRWLEQLPNPQASIARIMPMARRAASGRPWGSRANWDTFALRKSMAEALGQAATQAPQPMQAAASMARSARSAGTGRELASDALPVLTEM